MVTKKENESHFVTSCPLYILDRENCFEILNDEQKLFSMSNECPVVTETVAIFLTP